MTLLPRNRVLLAGAALLPALLLVALLYLRSRPTTIGDFTLPTLPGWKQGIFKTDHAHKVVYTKLGNDHTSRISFAWQVFRLKNPPKNIQDVQNQVAKGIQAVTRLQKSSGSKIKWVAPHSVPLNGMTVIESQSTTTSPSGITRAKAIHFLNGPNYYVLNSSTSAGSPSVIISPEAQAEMDAALETVTKSLTPSPR